jgi:acyl dehydratase
VITIATLADLRARVGQEIGASGWLVIDQQRINAFADATGDHQWIHVDAERAARETPFGTTIAHGFLTLSLVSALMRNTVSIGGLRMTINYGLNRVRFVSPVPSGARVRARVALGAVEDVKDATQATWNITVEREGADKPALIAEWLVRYFEGVEVHEGREEGREGHEG